MQTSNNGLELIMAFEGIADGDPMTVPLDPYLDPVGIWTIGYGHAIADKGRLLRGTADRARARALYPDGITREEAIDLLAHDVMIHEVTVAKAVSAELPPHAFDALVSFCFNVGPGRADRPGEPGKDGLVRLRSGQPSTLLRKVNGGDMAGAAAEFSKWNKSGGIVLRGLTRRRRAESWLFLGEDWRQAG